jgi:hypothetical protein
MLEVFPNGSKGYPKDLNMFGVHPSISKNSIIEKSYHIEDPLLYFILLLTTYNTPQPLYPKNLPRYLGYLLYLTGQEL